MPTCSQAKIINNLETDLHKRLYSLTNQEIDLNLNASLEYQTIPPRVTVEYFRRHQLGAPYGEPNRSRRLSSRRPSYRSNRADDESLFAQIQANLSKKLPSISADCSPIKKDKVSKKFVPSTPQRKKSDVIINLNSSIRKSPLSDNDENYSTTRMNSDGYSTNSWSISSETGSPKNSEHISLYKTTRTNMRFEQPVKEEREQSGKTREATRRSSLINNLTAFNTLPKLALEIEAIENMETDDYHVDDSTTENQNDLLNKRRDSVNAVKRLLSLASIRPSKTFHKEITKKETEVLKRYYEVLKPRSSITTSAKNDKSSLEKNQNDQIPILYDSAKINFESLNQLEMFLNEHKTAICEGKLVIEYNVPGYNGFVLKDQQTEEIFKFPQNSYDTFVALVISKSSRGNVNLDENHILQSVNWNDRTSVFPRKLSKTDKLSKKATKPIESPVNLDTIKSMCDLVSSTVDLKLTKQVIHNGMDLR
jgi:hypothetical protein